MTVLVPKRKWLDAFGSEGNDADPAAINNIIQTIQDNVEEKEIVPRKHVTSRLRVPVGTDKYNVTASLPTIKDLYNIGDDSERSASSGGTYQAWGQTFTPSTSYQIVSVKLLLYRSVTYAGTAAVAIRATDANGLPTGADLCSGSTSVASLPSGSPYEWRLIDFGAGAALTAGTKYAITVTPTSFVYWRCDVTSPSYYEGNSCYLSSGTWTTFTDDFMFETNAEDGALPLDGTVWVEGANLHIIDANRIEKTIIAQEDVDDTPVDAATTAPVSSNWAYDHVAAADPHTGYMLESILTAQGNVIYASAASTPAVLAPGTAGQLLRTAGASANPSWTTAVYPNTTVVNQLLYSSATNTITGITTANSNILVTGGTGIPAWATDIPTAVTIGTAYIYRVGGTDVAVADGGTGLSSYTANNLLYASGTTTIAGLATANSGILVTSGAGVPSIATDIPTAVTIGTAYIYRVGGTDIPITDGGTGTSVAATAFDNLSPLTTLGDIIYYSTTGARLAGNITTTKKYLVQTGTGAVSASPVWDTIAVADVPTLNQNTTGSANSLKSPATTGLMTATGMGAGTTRAKTIRDADDTILELGGTYTPSGTWVWTTATVTWPTFNQNTTGSAAKWTTARTLAGNSVDGSANVAFSNAFIVQGTVDAGLTGAQFLGALGTGIVKNTTTTGVLSIAVAGDFPTLNQNTTGTAAGLSVVLVPASGGTGVANGTLNLITFTGNYGLGLTLTAATAVTLPTTGTLATTANITTDIATHAALTTGTHGVGASTIASAADITTHAALITGVHGLVITAGKTFTLTNSLTLSGTDTSTLNIGTGGTLGTAAYATIALYATLASPTFTGTVTIPTPFTLGIVSVTATGTELNYVVGVTSAIQTQLGLKAPLASPTFTGTVTLPTPFTLGIVSVTATGTELNYSVGVTSGIQAQLNLKAPLASPTFTGTVTIPTPFTIGAVSMTATGTQLNYVVGVTSAIQTQIDGKSPTAGNASLVTVGTITSGVWNATDIPVSAGGTGLSAITALSIWVANSANTIAEITPGAGNSIRINAGGTAWEAFTPGTGTVTSVSVVSANGFAGTVATATTTPAITISTSITGILLGDGTAVTGLASSGTGNVVRVAGATLTTPTLGIASATSLATSAAIPLLLTNGQLVNIALTSQTIGTTTLTIPDFASVVDEFVFKTKAVTMSNKTFVAPALGAATGTSLQLSGLTASEILGTDASKNLVSLAVATYPSLTELTYVKGVTSAIQTQLGLKAPLASPTFTGTVTVPTPYTIGAVSMTATGTQLNYLNAATGTTGTTTTNIVFSASPTFTGTVALPIVTTTGAITLPNNVGINLQTTVPADAEFVTMTTGNQFLVSSGTGNLNFFGFAGGNARLAAQAATGGVTIRNSPTWVWRATYWTGAASVNWDASIIHTMDATTPKSTLGLTINAVAAQSWENNNGTISVYLPSLTSNGFVKTSGGTGVLSIDTTAYSTLGYTLSVFSGQVTPADAGLMYFGSAIGNNTTAGRHKMYIRKAGTITIAEIYTYSGIAGSAEDWSFYVRLNDTTDTLIATVSASANERIFSNTGLSIAVVAGDFIEIKAVNPTWVTNPSTVSPGGYVYIE